MDNGMESMLDTYLFETNSLLDNLDEMLVKDEKSPMMSMRYSVSCTPSKVLPP